jgi:ATP-dependent Lon protease
VLFISTANVSETIPGPLLDRMEVIRLDGYTEDEKVVIARDHLLARQEERNGLRSDEVEMTDDAVRQVVSDYTREAGVRNLERELGKVLRQGGHSARERIRRRPPFGSTSTTSASTSGGRGSSSRPPSARASPASRPGSAVTGTGGDVLFIEATRLEGDGKDPLMLTGQLGDVMKESGQIALSYVRSHARELGIDPSNLGGRFHVHVPAGAVPKDGPSAGVTMVTAIASLLADTPVKSTVG